MWSHFLSIVDPSLAIETAILVLNFCIAYRLYGLFKVENCRKKRDIAIDYHNRCVALWLLFGFVVAESYSIDMWLMYLVVSSLIVYTRVEHQACRHIPTDPNYKRIKYQYIFILCLLIFLIVVYGVCYFVLGVVI